METLTSKDDAAFRAASLEHSKLLTDLQASHLKHMEGMMAGNKSKRTREGGGSSPPPPVNAFAWRNLAATPARARTSPGHLDESGDIGAHHEVPGEPNSSAASEQSW